MKSKTVVSHVRNVFPVTFAHHTFEETPDHQIAHLIDGKLCAVIPPEGWEGYCTDYPEMQDIIDAMTS